VLNLIHNASEAMSSVADRPRRMLVRVKRSGSDAVGVTVEDVGIGFELTNPDRLFDAFFTTKTEGMGIGLSVSRSIIERHGGRMWAETNRGPGASFSFSIPLAQPARSF
jgi:signal transduction histidine kinase